MVATSSFLASAAWSRRGSGRVNAESLADMLDLGITQAERFRRVVLAGYGMCAVAAALGLVGYGIRVHFYRPLAMSPIEPLVLLGLAAVALLLFGRLVTSDLARLTYLRGLLTEAAAQDSRTVPPVAGVSRSTAASLVATACRLNRLLRPTEARSWIWPSWEPQGATAWNSGKVADRSIVACDRAGHMLWLATGVQRASRRRRRPSGVSRS